MGRGSVSHHDELGGLDAERAQADRFGSGARNGRGVSECRSRGGCVRFDHAGKEPQSVPEAALLTLGSFGADPMRWCAILSTPA
jgi:hypothetical protein